jgi:hypothetical protein
MLASMVTWVQGAWAQEAKESKATTPEAAADVAVRRAGPPAPRRARKPSNWSVQDARVRITFMAQDGRGYQSQAGPHLGPGKETLLVFQPMAGLSLRQKKGTWRHDFIAAIDVVSSASADALDVVSKASRDNEAADFSVTSSVADEQGSRWSLNYGFHFEEHWRTGFAGLGWSRAFLHEQTFLSLMLSGIYDGFDQVLPDGNNDIQRDRGTVAVNGSVQQILSPTTIADLSYGLTYQVGTLETTWNSVPIGFGPGDIAPADGSPSYAYRTRERLPEKRLRHALATRWAQHLPWSHTTFQLHYRYYFDDFGIQAHTVSPWLYQYFGRSFFVRAGWRWHQQEAARFWRRQVPVEFPVFGHVTSDSDLAAFHAHQPSMKLVWVLRPRRKKSAPTLYLDASYSRYWRSNNLHVDLFSLGFARSL